MILALLSAIVLCSAILLLTPWFPVVVQIIKAKRSLLPQFPDRDPFTGYEFRKAEREAGARGDLRSWYRENFKKYGSTYVCISWGQQVIHTMEPANFQTILSFKSDCFGVWPSRGPNSVPWLGKGALTTDGSFWQLSRDVTKPIFAKSQIADLKRLEMYVKRLIELIPKNGETVDLQGLFMRMYLDYSTDFLFGESAQSLEANVSSVDAAKFIESFDRSLLHVRYAQTTPRVCQIIERITGKWHEPFRESQKYAEKLIQAATERFQTKKHASAQDEPNEANFVFLDELIASVGKVDKAFIRGQMMNMFFPARHTSSTGISLVFFQLARQPKVWQKVRDEVRAGPVSLDFEGTSKLRYTNAAVCEALRLGSAASSANRTALNDCLLAQGSRVDTGTQIPISKGTHVVMHFHATHRDVTVWGADADMFMPERWLDSDVVIRQRRSWQYLPFSGGPRICPAARLMETQFTFIVATFARAFERLENRDLNEVLVEDHRVTMQSRNGVQVALWE